MISVPWQWGQCRTCIIMLSLGWLGGCSASHTPQENSRPTPLKHPRAPVRSASSGRQGRGAILGGGVVSAQRRFTTAPAFPGCNASRDLVVPSHRHCPSSTGEILGTAGDTELESPVAAAG